MLIPNQEIDLLNQEGKSCAHFEESSYFHGNSSSVQIESGVDFPLQNLIAINKSINQK